VRWVYLAPIITIRVSGRLHACLISDPYNAEPGGRPAGEAGCRYGAIAFGGAANFSPHELPTLIG